jgi:hypothetical protein
MGGEAEEHFRLWLRAGMTGCSFARMLTGGSKRTAVVAEIQPIAGQRIALRLNTGFDAHARADRVAVAVFPLINCEGALIELLNTLACDSRWRIRCHPQRSPSAGVLVGLEWITASGHVSEAMGFAPFGTMPVPRRAPYVAIATWPGRAANPFRGRGVTPPGKPDTVSFLDAAHGFEERRYEAMWSDTTRDVTSLMKCPPDDAKLYRRTAFVLTADSATKLAS